MCGRFAIFSSKQGVMKLFNILNNNFSIPKNYNVFPSQSVPVIFKKDRELHSKFIIDMKFGINSKWSKNKNLINVRSESLQSKPMFKEPFERRRCLIPANGYFEWKKNKQPHYFCSQKGQLFAFAGVYNIEAKS